MNVICIWVVSAMLQLPGVSAAEVQVIICLDKGVDATAEINSIEQVSKQVYLHMSMQVISKNIFLSLGNRPKRFLSNGNSPKSCLRD